MGGCVTPGDRNDDDKSLPNNAEATKSPPAPENGKVVDAAPPKKVNEQAPAETSGGDAGAGKEGGGGAGSEGTSSSPITIMGNVFDKLTDVLNLGRVISIGLPGFVAASGLLLLLARFTTPLAIPRGVSPAVDSVIGKWLPPPPDTAEARRLILGAVFNKHDSLLSKFEARLLLDAHLEKPDTLLTKSEARLILTALLDEPDSLSCKSEARLNLTMRLLHIQDSLWTASLPTLYYDRLPLDSIPLRIRDQMLGLRIGRDFRTVVKYWRIWFVVAILMGCLITVWGYWHLLRRALLRDTWQKLIDEILPKLALPAVEKETKDEREHRKGQLAAAMEEARKRPRTWRTLDKHIKELKNYCDAGSVDLLDKLWREMLGVRFALYDHKYSWTNMHSPLMGGNKTGMEGMSLLDYLVKEYWRFVEFSVNLPIAALLCAFFLGIYFFTLSPSHGHFGIIGTALFLAAGIGLLLLHRWTDSVGLNQYDKYHMAVNGTIAGIMLLVRQDKDPNCLFKYLDDDTKVPSDILVAYKQKFRENLNLPVP